MLHHHFSNALQPYTTEQAITTLWQELEKAYKQRGRHYHTLQHLEALLQELLQLQTQFNHWPTVVLAIAWHDVVYNVLKQNNEEKSAEFAVARLKQTTFPADQIERCQQLILATKKHEPVDEETNLFTDADLSVLGADAETYQQYTQQIRKEYSIYPNLVYNPGRKKVLQHFLSMPRIYKTDVFYGRYEKQARVNLAWELASAVS
jgi:predicted metal-dependent HD superfamily phosphohydrolase